VAGTEEGITALQLDIKITGITHDIMKKALEQARVARLAILDKMNATIKEARSEISEYAPQITSVMINPEKIGTLIGPGGKMIRKIIEETGANINVDDTGEVQIAATERDSMLHAIKMVKDLTQEIEVGMVFDSVVTKIMNFGAFCDITPTTSGLVHVSELSNEYVAKVENVVKLGDTLKVKVIGIDPQGKQSKILWRKMNDA